jgi:hypothetical protein
MVRGQVMHCMKLLSATAIVLLVLVVASGLVLPARGAASTVAVEPQIVDVAVGSNFSIDISIRNVGYMLSFHFKITWDPNLVRYVSRTLLLQPGWSVETETVDGLGGTYVLQATGGMFSGDALWVTLTFHCLGGGSSPIGISPDPDSWWENPSVLIPFDVVLGGTCNQHPVVPVGGVVLPVNRLAVMAPYLALLGLVAAVAVVVVKPWKKPEN